MATHPLGVVNTLRDDALDLQHLGLYTHPSRAGPLHFGLEQHFQMKRTPV